MKILGSCLLISISLYSCVGKANGNTSPWVEESITVLSLPSEIGMYHTSHGSIKVQHGQQMFVLLN